MTEFPNLFRPIDIAGLRIQNRIVKAPMCTNYATPDGFVTPEMIAYYRERARGGAGLVIVEFTYIDNIASKSWHRQLGVEDDDKMEGLSRLAAVIREQGAVSALQICHCGSQRLLPGGPPRVPSASAASEGREVREVDEAEIHQIVSDFGEAARRGKEAGFDLIEIHGANGYLMDGFFSPEANRRTDAFGGNLQNRLRFSRMVVETVRKAVGETYPLGIRMSGSGLFRGGMIMTDACEAARAFVQDGVDLIHITAGNYETRHLRSTPAYGKRGNLVPLAAAIKKVSSVPVIASGGLSNPVHLEAVIREGRAEMVSMARQLHAEPAWANKVREGRLEDLRPCIRCNSGCLRNGLQGNRVLCDVNPTSGFEAEFVIEPADTPKKVAVIGGGPAGMEAARILTLRGHRVTLFEGRDHLGGALVPATRPDFKTDLRSFLEFQIRQVEKLPIEIRRGRRATPDTIAEVDAEEVVLAVGAEFVRPAAISGCGGPKVVTADRALVDESWVGESVVVVGAGVKGCETAWHFARKGRRVTLLEMKEELAPKIEGMHRPFLIKGLEDSGVNRLLRSRVTAIADDGTVRFRVHGVVDEIPADTVILSVGVEPKKGLYGVPANLNIPVHAVGDCAKPGGLFGAMLTGALVGRTI